MCSSSSAPSDGARGDAHDDSGEQPTCSFLSVGQAFEGTQNVSDGMQLLGCKEEAWSVNVRFHGCDLQQVGAAGASHSLPFRPLGVFEMHHKRSHVQGTHSRTKKQGGTPTATIEVLLLSVF
jgi:hypothetical protein